MEHPELDWRSRIEYLKAKTEQRKTELYAMDLLWLLTRAETLRYGAIDIPLPSDMEWRRSTKDTRSAQQIRIDLLKRLKEI